MIEPVWIEYILVIAIHQRSLAEHGGSDGIRDKGLLESALFRPKNLLAYSEATIFDLAAAYGYGITQNHPFIDGNKRTAHADFTSACGRSKQRTSYVVMRTFLKLNGYDIRASAVEKYEIWLRLANSQISEADLATWIEEKSFKITD